MPKENRTYSNKIPKTFNVLLPTIIALATIIGMIAGFRLQNTKSSSSLIQKVESNNSVGIGRIEEVIRFIESKYVDELDADQMIEDALMSVMQELDPHSVYISKERLEEVNSQLKGSYEGFGIETISYQDTFVIIDVIKDGPAERAGINVFDKIVNILGDHKLEGEYDPEVIRQLLQGARGSNNSLVIKRADTNVLDTVQVTVGEVGIKNADIAYMINDSIGYIKIERFNSNIYKEFMESLERLYLEDSVKHLVIDVRQNPGGYLPETTKILSQLFAEKERLLVYTEGKSDEKLEYKTTGKVFFPIDKLAVLIDEGSASGSEIIAGAIQDWDRGVILGRRSYGKGLVQEQYALSSGDALRLTVARYFTPSGRSIQKPFNDDEAYDEELTKRVENGELQDSEKITVGDTTQYFTKIKKRVVYGGGGIIPDIFIPKSIDDHDGSLEHLDRVIPEFCYTILSEANQLYPANYEEYEKSAYSEKSFAKDFESYLMQEEYLDKEIPEKYFRSLDKLIQAKLIRIKYGKIQEYKFRNINDIYISEAVKAIDGRDIFAELSEED